MKRPVRQSGQSAHPTGTATSSDSAHRVLILGASGMLGNAAMRVFTAEPGYEVCGTVRSSAAISHFSGPLRERIIAGIEAENADHLLEAVARFRPDTILNCIGVIKQFAASSDPLVALPLNAILPHRLARLCQAVGARLVHISTDCVFDGRRGDYREGDVADATDLYGRSKLLGEVDYPNAITLRTSIVGHELTGNHALLDWFLSQENAVNGFVKAIFSGLTTVELSRVVARHVVPRPELRGLYHLSADPISKHDLLSLVADVYGKNIDIVPCETPVIDRSLSSEKFRAATGYTPPNWRTLVRTLKECYGR